MLQQPRLRHGSLHGDAAALTLAFLIANGLVLFGLVAIALGSANPWYAALSLLVFVAQSFYVKASVRHLDDSHIALVCLLGAPVYSAYKSGSFLAPALICDVRLLPRNPIPTTATYANVLCGRGNRECAKENSSDREWAEAHISNDYAIVSVIMEFEFQIEPASAAEFVGTFGSVEHARSILTSSIHGDVTAVFGRRGLRESMGDATAICAAIVDCCNSAFSVRGISVTDMRVASIDLGEAVTKAMESVDKAMYESVLTISDSEAKLRRILEQQVGRVRRSD